MTDVWSEYEEHFRKEGLPKIAGSNFTISLMTNTDPETFDVKQATELGAILLLDKPLILLGMEGAVIPSRLRKAADIVVEDWSPENKAKQLELRTALNTWAEARDGS